MWNLLNFVENVRNISDSPQKRKKRERNREYRMDKTSIVSYLVNKFRTSLTL